MRIVYKIVIGVTQKEKTDGCGAVGFPTEINQSEGLFEDGV